MNPDDYLTDEGKQFLQDAAKEAGFPPIKSFDKPTKRDIHTLYRLSYPQDNGDKKTKVGDLSDAFNDARDENLLINILFNTLTQLVYCHVVVRTFCKFLDTIRTRNHLTYTDCSCSWVNQRFCLSKIGKAFYHGHKLSLCCRRFVLHSSCCFSIKLSLGLINLCVFCTQCLKRNHPTRVLVLR